MFTNFEEQVLDEGKEELDIQTSFEISNVNELSNYDWDINETFVSNSKAGIPSKFKELEIKAQIQQDYMLNLNKNRKSLL